MRLPASGSWWSEQILDTVPNERFCARDLKESKSDRTHPAAFLCVKRNLQSRGIGQICVCFDAKGKSCTKGKHAKRFPLWRERIKAANFVCCRCESEDSQVSENGVVILRSV